MLVYLAEEINGMNCLGLRNAAFSKGSKAVIGFSFVLFFSVILFGGNSLFAHESENGANFPVKTVNEAPIAASDSTDDEYVEAILPEKCGGTVICWKVANPSKNGFRLVAQRLDSEKNAVWNERGISLSKSDEQISKVSIHDKEEMLFIFWLESKSESAPGFIRVEAVHKETGRLIENDAIPFPRSIGSDVEDFVIFESGDRLNIVWLHFLRKGSYELMLSGLEPLNLEPNSPPARLMGFASEDAPSIIEIMKNDVFFRDSETSTEEGSGFEFIVRKSDEDSVLVEIEASGINGFSKSINEIENNGKLLDAVISQGTLYSIIAIDGREGEIIEISEYQKSLDAGFENTGRWKVEDYGLSAEKAFLFADDDTVKALWSGRSPEKNNSLIKSVIDPEGQLTSSFLGNEGEVGLFSAKRADDGIIWVAWEQKTESGNWGLMHNILDRAGRTLPEMTMSINTPGTDQENPILALFEKDNETIAHIAWSGKLGSDRDPLIASYSSPSCFQYFEIEADENVKRILVNIENPNPYSITVDVGFRSGSGEFFPIPVVLRAGESDSFEMSVFAAPSESTKAVAMSESPFHFSFEDLGILVQVESFSDGETEQEVD